MNADRHHPARDHFDADLEPVPIPVRLLLTFSPLALFGVIFVLTYVLAGMGTLQLMVSMVVASFIGLGKFVVFAGVSDNALLSPYALAALVVLGDLATALILLFNVHLFFKIPKLGGQLRMMQRSGHEVLRKHKWIRTISWLGLASFVAVPFQGTGSVLGVFIGRILGLTRTSIVAAIMTGASIGSFGLAALAGILGKTQQEHIQQISGHPYLVAAIIGGMLLITTLLGRWFIGDINRHPENHRHDKP